MRYLMLEDDPRDAELIDAALSDGGLGGEIVRVETTPQFQKRFTSEAFDVVLADYNLPRSSALAVLRVVREVNPEIPFIVVSGNIGEEQAIDALKLGATDHVLKDRLARLVPAVRRALGEAEERRRRRLAEEQRDRFYALSQDLFCVADTENHLLDINPAWEWRLGWTREQLLSQPYDVFVHPDDRHATDDAARAVASGQRLIGFENRFKTAGGQYRWFHWNATLDIERKRIFAVGRDITDLMRVQSELRARANQQAAVAELGRLALEGAEQNALCDRAAQLVSEALDVPLSGVLELLPDRRELVLRASFGWDRKLIGSLRVPAGNETQLGFALTSNTTVVLEDIPRERRFETSTYLRESGVVSGMAVVIRGRERPFGVLSTHSRTRRAFTQDDTSFLQSIANVLAAAIERQRGDDALSASEAKLRQAQKMEAIGQLAGGVAHDFNNLLTAILGFAQLGEDECDESQGSLRHYLTEIHRAGLRAADVTRQLLAFSRRQILQSRAIDPNEALRTITPLLRRLLGEDISLTLELGTELGLIEVDPSQFDQVIVNLAVNARDAMPHGGLLKISTSLATPDPERVVPGLEVDAVPLLRVAVEDHGCGIDADTLTRMFEPFFTTKSAGKGTGLGLATVYGIVKQSNGTLSVSSELSVGTTVEVYLPRTAAKAPLPHRVNSRTSARAGAETVLLVEDDAAIRTFVHKVLAQHGYHVLEAADRKQALAVAHEHAARIQLLITDIVMPGGNGNALAAELLSAGKVDHVLFMSGFLTHPLVALSQLEPDSVFLPKPFTHAELLRSVRAVLRGVRR